VIGVLLINLGTPDAPEPAAVRRYLAEFLSDRRVVEIPPIAWQPILRGIILNTRPKKSAHAYSQVWREDGSPLAAFTRAQAAALAARGIGIVETPVGKLEHAQGSLRAVRFVDGAETPLAALYARVPFAQHCPIPASLGCESTPEGYLKVDPLQRTTRPGVFACGDNSTALRTVANAVASGTTAGMMVNKEMALEFP